MSGAGVGLLPKHVESALYAYGIAQQEVGRAYGRGDPDDADECEAPDLPAELAEWQLFASAQRDDAERRLRLALGALLSHPPQLTTQPGARSSC